MDLDADCLTIGQLREISKLVGGKVKATRKVRPRDVVVRSGQSGVWIGKLVGQRGDTVDLVDACKIWSWQGANTTSDIALTGVAKGAKVAPPVTVTVFGCCEIVDATAEAMVILRGRGWGT